MTLLGRRQKIETGVLMDRLAAGAKQCTLAAEFGCHYQTVRKCLARHVRRSGFKSVEQAVAFHVAQRIKAGMPIALQSSVDLCMARFK